MKRNWSRVPDGGRLTIGHNITFTLTLKSLENKDKNVRNTEKGKV
jgi:hypothetical protein